MFNIKKICCLLTSFLIVFSFCSCKSSKIYRIDKREYYYGNQLTLSISYTYFGKMPLERKSTYYNLPQSDSVETFNYNEKGELVSYTFSNKTSQSVTYNAEKITSNKYLFRNADGSEFATMIFDESGFIISERYAMGKIYEIAFTKDENGKPTAVKELFKNPSGSSKIIDYSVTHSSNHYRIIPVGEDTAQSIFYYTQVE